MEKLKRKRISGKELLEMGNYTAKDLENIIKVDTQAEVDEWIKGQYFVLYSDGQLYLEDKVNGFDCLQLFDVWDLSDAEIIWDKEV